MNAISAYFSTMLFVVKDTYRPAAQAPRTR